MGISDCKSPGKILFCFTIPAAMELMMYLGNDLIESVTVNEANLSQPGYLGAFKRQLKQKYWSLIQETGQLPEFLVASLSPGNKEVEGVGS